eukprot:6207259-Pleurochrysis_carterae.AAC.2
MILHNAHHEGLQSRQLGPRTCERWMGMVQGCGVQSCEVQGREVSGGTHQAPSLSDCSRTRQPASALATKDRSVKFRLVCVWRYSRPKDTRQVCAGRAGQGAGPEMCT